MRPSGLIVLVLALVLGGAAAFMAREFLLSRTLQPTPAPEFKTLVVARQALPFGTALNDENTVEITWPMATTLEDGFATKAQLFKEGRRVVLVPLQRNEPILASKITGPNQRATLSTMIEEGMRAVSVRVDDVRGVAGFVQPGDRVDVILTRGEGTVGDSAFADVLLQNVRVLGIDQLVGDKQDRPTVARAVTLELNVQQSQKVILAQGIGRLSLVLRQAGGADPEPARRVTAADLGLAEYVEKKEAPKPEPAPPPVVKVDPNTIVNVFRGGGKREQYSVITEDPRRATR